MSYFCAKSHQEHVACSVLAGSSLPTTSTHLNGSCCLTCTASKQHAAAQLTIEKTEKCCSLGSNDRFVPRHPFLSSRLFLLLDQGQKPQAMLSKPTSAGVKEEHSLGSAPHWCCGLVRRDSFCVAALWCSVPIPTPFSRSLVVGPLTTQIILARIQSLGLVSPVACTKVHFTTFHTPPEAQGAPFSPPPKNHEDPVLLPPLSLIVSLSPSRPPALLKEKVTPRTKMSIHRLAWPLAAHTLILPTMESRCLCQSTSPLDMHNGTRVLWGCTALSNL